MSLRQKEKAEHDLEVLAPSLLCLVPFFSPLGAQRRPEQSSWKTKASVQICHRSVTAADGAGCRINYATRPGYDIAIPFDFPLLPTGTGGIRISEILRDPS